VLVGAEGAAAARLPGALPPVTLEPLGYAGRLALWRAGLPGAAGDPELERAMADCARRFRLEAPALARVCAALSGLGRPARPEDLYAACRSDVDLGELASPVAPRFELAELMLPQRQARQVEELIRAATALTRVHHEWGTARAWSESGLSALFAGPPGTGKTMAAEVVAQACGMPLFRIDLSQVVNKYIGETEKNLRRLFDAADAADVLLFFDEADALFGKRTEVKDAHDRYANLEVSYLLERMERFKGLAILATNRRKDLDEAFLRRLRFVIEFPLPGPEERLRIWQSVIPAAVDADALDLAFLADRFALAGGHIRSVVFQACLQSARAGAPRRLDMPTVACAVRRELEKLGRTISLDQFGPWAEHVKE
jgi:MoxR-like ATPase